MGLSGKLSQFIALPGVLIIIFAIVAAAAATTAIISKPGCPDKCGDVEIPFPFGFTEDCYLDGSFRLTCQSSTTPIIGNNTRVRNISIDTHELHVLNNVARDCPTDGINNRTQLSVPLYTISSSKNKFTVIGCDTTAYLSGYQNGEEYKIGCSSQCPTPKNVGNGFCSGVGCCEVRFPNRLKNISIEVQSFNNHYNVWDFNPCGYAFVVEKSQFNFSASYLQNYTNQTVPLVLDWAVSNLTCEEARNKPNFACKDSNSECIDNQTSPDGYRCQCKQGYRGNPYLPHGQGGCDVIDECADQTLNNCTKQCTNGIGNYTCGCPKWYHRGDGRKDDSGCSVDPLLATMGSIGIGIGLTAMVGGSWWLYLEFQAKLSIKLKAKFIRRSRGQDLEKHLQGSTAEEAKIFTYEELKKATNNFEKKRIIGKGVCQGFLLNDRINVAIKKSKTVDPDQADQFINEIIQLSKIEYENVVKLLGCCLETEVPLLVYEFVPEGTLFDYIHNESNTFTKQWKWETRLRIAAETAGGLSYLHSLTIIHRDVKSSNILLGKDFTAKVSNFEISKLVPHDEKDVATVVQRTHGYLDPEYLQTNQLTKKSDVYSFGVILVELLTGIDVAPSTRSKKRINVGKYFLSLLKENQLSELLDCDIVEEGNEEQIKEVVKLAERCLRLKGDERPTMEELKNELEGIRKTKTHSSVNVQLNLEKPELDLLGDHADEDGGCSICNISLGCWPQMNEYV